MAISNIPYVVAQGASEFRGSKQADVRKITMVTAPDGEVLPDIVPHVWIEEHHHDQSEITSHPVEFGAQITDHVFKHPAEVTLKLGWSNSPSGNSGLLTAAEAYGVANSPLLENLANAVGLFQGAQSALNGADTGQINAAYAILLACQERACTFTLVTGKRPYTSMVIKSLTTETDLSSANALLITVVCQQLIIVSTKTVKLAANAQKFPGTAAPTFNGTINGVVDNSLGAQTMALLGY